MSTKFNIYLTSLILGALPVVSHAYSEWVQSAFQEEENYFYVAIGGGGASQRTDHWKTTNSNVFNTLGFTDVTANQPNDHNDVVGVGLFAIGYAFPGAPVRLEVAYNYIGQGKYTSDELFTSSTPSLTATESMTGEARIQSNTIMLNGYLDFIITENWIPYIMIGGGWGLNSTKFNWDFIADDISVVEEKSDSNNKSNFAWNAGVGLTYAFDDTISIGVQATYVGLGKAEFNAKPYSINDNHSDEEFLKVDDLSAITGTVNVAYHF